MSIVDHVAIFLHGSLDQARESQAKKGKFEFYGRFAFPPAAQDDLMAAIAAVAPNGIIAGLQLAPKLHSSLPAAKQFAGIPLDWFIVRMSSGPDYPPELFAVDGTKLAALPINGTQIRADFYAGQRVRVNTYAFYYPPKGGGSAGVSFNLSGVMAVGGGERMPGGNSAEPSESAFAAYRSGAQPSAAQDAPALQQSGATPAAANPFQVGSAGKSAASPFG